MAVVPFQPRGDGRRDFSDIDPKATPKFTLRTAADFAVNLSCDYLVKGMLDREAAAILYGPTNVGKTFFALDLALAVAAGEEWRGRRVKQGRVVYIASEGGRRFVNRIAAACDGPPPDGFAWLPMAVDLTDRAQCEALAEAIEEFGGCDLLVVDTVARCMTGDENQAADMGAFIRGADYLRTRLAAATLGIHHSGKDEARGARGSYSLPCAIDTEFALGSDDGVITLTTKKQRDMETAAPMHLTLERVTLGFDDDGDEVTSARVVEADAPEAKRKPLSAPERIVFDAVLELAAAEGQPNPAGAGWPEPGAVRTIERDRLREFTMARLPQDSAEARKKAFNRALKSLTEAGRIGCNGDRFWPMRQDSNGDGA